MARAARPESAERGTSAGRSERPLQLGGGRSSASWSISRDRSRITWHGVAGTALAYGGPRISSPGRHVTRVAAPTKLSFLTRQRQSCWKIAGRSVSLRRTHSWPSMMRATRRLLVALSLALAMTPNACAERSSDSRYRRVAVFEAHDIWDGDSGSTMARLGLPQQAVYRLDSLGRPVKLSKPEACCIAGLTLSPAGDRIACLAYGADPPVTPEQRAATGVRVADVSGSRIAWFPGCYAPCRPRDGERVAMIEGASPESIGWLNPIAVRIVERSGRSQTFGFQPRSIAWGNGETLFLEYEDRVDALDVGRSRSWRTAHLGCQISPDGWFSFGYRGLPQFLRVRENPGGLELGSCLLSILGSDRERPLLAPFWIRSSAGGHLLCLSISPSFQSPPGQAAVRTVVVDPRTMEVLHELPGKLVSPTNDHRSLVLLRGDTLAPVDLPKWEPEPSRPVFGRIRLQIYGWGSGALSGRPRSQLVSDSIHVVRDGDWLSSSRAYIGDCVKFIRVLRAPDPGHVELEIVPSMLGPMEAGAGPVPLPPRQLLLGTRRLTIGSKPVTLRTPFVDGGYDVVLSLVP